MADVKRTCCGGGNACSDGGRIDRRSFLEVLSIGGTALGAAVAAGLPAVAGPFEAKDFEKLIPADKKLSPEWIKSLYARGRRTVYRGAELEKIGMPIGGLCAGQLYLGGDGRLWHWDIFNQPMPTGDDHYAHPPKPISPVEQTFSILVGDGKAAVARPLDRSGFRDVTFCGEYPIGYVEYRDPDVPVAISLEAFSPFVPLDPLNSSYPATVMQFTVRNTSEKPVNCQIGGTLQNAVCLHRHPDAGGRRTSAVRRTTEATILEFGASTEPKSEASTPANHRDPFVFADFEGESFAPWKVDGDAFGAGPRKGPTTPEQHLSNFQGKSLANSWTGSDAPHGKLTSPDFKIERPFINFLIGGGNHPGETCIDLVLGDKVVRTATGKNSDAMEWAHWNVKELAGKTARIEIVDRHSGGWGHIEIDQIEFADEPRASDGPVEKEADFGTMALALVGVRDGDLTSARLGGAASLAEQFALLGKEQPVEAKSPLGEKMLGMLSRPLSLAPGGEAKVTFIVAWHFPNLRMDRLPGGRFYATRFKSAGEVAAHVAKNLPTLAAQTRLWHDTWYDSTLPYWFLDRTFLNISILATSTCHWFTDGRFYGWEGVNCCPGTCTHVWHYAQALARLFPSLERDTRERVDFGLAYHPDTGAMGFRAEFDAGVAVDGQSGTILRAFREHQMSTDGAFLNRIWPRVKKAAEFLIAQDPNRDGILDGPQMNTLDAAWFGQIAWLSSLYVAALKAAEQMAREMGDAVFAATAAKLAEAGGQNIDRQLFNGEYFVQTPDRAHEHSVGSFDGCEIDQVFGQSWACQVGLGRVLPQGHTRAALRSLWRYNFTPDVGPWRAANKPGRWYAMAGEGGLIMCTWPRGDKARVQQGFDFYFNECMTGFEYQVAGHMIWEGLVEEGLAVTRMIHDRYHAARRNPWNEVECGDHYARAMASYGVFLAACGYEYHGPRGYLAFAPRISPENFRAAFTVAQGWGIFEQKRLPGEQQELIAVKWGKLRLRSLAFALPPELKPQRIKVTAAGKEIAAAHSLDDLRLRVELPADVLLSAGETLDVSIA